MNPFDCISFTEGMIREFVGEYEMHDVQTEDGYILNIIRIPKKNPKGIILFQHPIFFDARVWVSQGDNSAAFFFWKAGYDIWLGNTRGNMFCRKHVSYETTDRQFWDFSFHEMGYYDNCAIVEYIKHHTRVPKIIYLGLSMGGTSGLIFASTRLKICESSIKAIVVLAPVTHISNGTSIAKEIVPRSFTVLNFLRTDMRRSVLSPNAWYYKLSRLLVYKCPGVVRYFINLLSGFSDEEMQKESVFTMFNVFGAEIPFKLLSHFNQIYIKGGRFGFYDYREEKNLVVYGTKESPLYPIEKVKVPVIIAYGEKDNFTCPKDVDNLYSDLSNSEKHKKLMVEGFNHVDFIIHPKRDERAFNRILKELDRI